MDTTQDRLRQLLNASKINHKCAIMQQPTLHAAHIYCKIHKLSGQTTGGLIEAYICRQYNMVKNNASICAGDATHMGVNIEIKTSCGGHNHNKCNYVQIRVHQNCDYMLTTYYLHKSNVDQLGELFVFYLTKCNMIVPAGRTPTALLVNWVVLLRPIYTRLITQKNMHRGQNITTRVGEIY